MQVGWLLANAKAGERSPANSTPVVVEMASIPANNLYSVSLSA